MSIEYHQTTLKNAQLEMDHLINSLPSDIATYSVEGEQLQRRCDRISRDTPVQSTSLKLKATRLTSFMMPTGNGWKQ
ncbi:hypothetical protein CLOSTMETH_02220 [[Clostridium] methylpentosum DSM 5476]|uniref:Uncharacterized protein n=1 Tax=[Clostridium] methylpentosum DSM 5476 TaxID=537013 RepID=C0EEE0_9FIRM|nr:hypothetical protein CLOSTMETH_02220 [[Clostridium] methylpentosum DSM 5476]